MWAVLHASFFLFLSFFLSFFLCLCGPPARVCGLCFMRQAGSKTGAAKPLSSMLMVGMVIPATVVVLGTVVALTEEEDEDEDGCR